MNGICNVFRANQNWNTGQIPVDQVFQFSQSQEANFGYAGAQ